MTIEEMKRLKKERGYSYKEIAERSGVPVGTVQKIFGGITTSPRMDTIIALESVFKKDTPRDTYNSETTHYTDGYPIRNDNCSYTCVCEPAPAYNLNRVKKQGEYTLEDYYAIPDERRVELIDGVFYDMASPSQIHQLILGELFAQIHGFIRKNNGKCRVFPAPLDVRLDMDNRTMVQPDIVVICSRDRMNSRGGYGAPDFLIEILSPSTSKKDLTIKLIKYINAGVREYWIVDPDSPSVFTYRRTEDKVIMQTYSFDDPVPVGIWEDRCIIDFPDIKIQLETLPYSD